MTQSGVCQQSEAALEAFAFVLFSCVVAVRVYSPHTQHPTAIIAFD